MDVRDLAYLHAIIREGSVASAADAVGRTAPALTKAVRRLEDQLGAALFTRVGRGVEPTEAAIFLAERTVGVVEQLKIIRRQVKDVSEGRHGHVRLGVAATMAAIYLPSFLRRLTSAHPDLRVSIANGMNDVLHRALRVGEIDLVLGVIDRSDPAATECHVLAEDRVQIVAAAHHPLQGRKVSLEEVLPQRWVLPSQRVAMRQWFDAAFFARGYAPPAPHVETSSIAILEELIAGTDYLSFISGLKMDLPALKDRIAPLAIEDFTMTREIGATWMRSANVSPALGLALSVLKPLNRRG
ncbi:LysR family transcriptional regulator [Paracoccus yeei]|uniref:LysR family transcriptional regulator n=1 Tax=Paracoccus yeei TaxID=147645 RepID=UPI003BF77830